MRGPHGQGHGGRRAGARGDLTPPPGAAGPRGPVAVVGVGLIGGSLGLALRERAGASEVLGADPSEEALAAALAVGAITRAVASPEEAARGAEAVFLAAPVGEIPGLAHRVLRASGADTLVSDVGSAKAGVLGALGSHERERFVGGHPVCGGERGGVEHARPDLFEGATYFLTPAAEARADLYRRLHALVVALGARPVAIDAQVHDRLMALVSHLPHVVASALILQAAGSAPGGREALRSAGPSFRDLTRVAGANPPLWADIMLANAPALAEAVAAHKALLGEVERALGAGDREWLCAFMEQAAAGRARLRVDEEAGPGRPWRVVVSVPNRVGVLSEVATALGHAHINIEDLELRPAAPGEDRGELALVVGGEEDARRAAALVARRGFPARVEAQAPA